MEKEIEIHTADGAADGFLYRPDGDGIWPGVIHLTDIGGIRSANRDLSKRLASEGYVVLLPNVFYRTSKPPVFPPGSKHGDEKFMQRFQELAAPFTPEAIERDGSAYTDFLSKQESVGTGGFGIVGYCFTGGVALRMAAARPEKIAAVASFHGGRLFTDDPTSPHTVLPRVKARLYFGHAVEDRSMPKEAIENFERALESWGGRYESETYDGARHAWTMPDSPAYNQPQAERAFIKLSELFAVTLRSVGSGAKTATT
jgi:carboxymethylenebutenolidase